MGRMYKLPLQQLASTNSFLNFQQTSNLFWKYRVLWYVLSEYAQRVHPLDS